MIDEKLCEDVLAALNTNEDFNFLWNKCPTYYDDFSLSEEHKREYVTDVVNKSAWVFKKDVPTICKVVNTQLFILAILGEFYISYAGEIVDTKPDTFGYIDSISYNGTVAELNCLKGDRTYTLHLVINKLGSKYIETLLVVTGEKSSFKILLADFTRDNLKDILYRAFPEVTSTVVSKHIYAKACNPEYFDYTAYYDESQAVEDKFWAGGNRDFGDINAELYDDIVQMLEDLYSDLDTIESDDSYDSWSDKQDALVDATKSAVRYFDTSLELGITELQDIMDCANEYQTVSSSKENEVLCKALGILYDREFICGTIRGSSPSDWMEYICPKSLDPQIPYIEAVLFGTGTEYAITIEKLDHAPEDIYAEDVYHDYTDLYIEEDVKEWIASNAGCKPYEVIILDD